MRKGLKIDNGDGTKFIFDSLSCPAYIVWSGNLPEVDASEWVCPTSIPPGYDYCFITDSLGELTYKVSKSQGRSQWEVAGIAKLKTWLNDDRKPVMSWGTPTVTEAYVHIIAWPTPEVGFGHHGLRAFGENSIFTSLSDTSILSYLLYKGEVEIYNGWIPDNISSDFTVNNCSCFFYTDDHDKVIKYVNYARWDPAKEPGKADFRYNVYSKSLNGDASVKAKVCVFGKMDLQQEKGDKRYGLRIRNERGDITFNDGAGILASPRTVDLSTKGINQPFAIEGIRRPMYMPCGVGSGYSNHMMFRYGVNTVGTRVQVTENEIFDEPASHGGDIYYVAPYPMLFIDADDYFNF